MILFVAFFSSNCTTTRHYDLSLDKTLSIFLLNNGENEFFCIPVQYMGDYQIESFEFSGGYIQIGDYEILLKRDEVNIYIYLNETADIDGSAVDEFNLIHSEENGKISISKMDEPLAAKHGTDETLNHYYFFIEKHLSNNEVEKIADEYEKGNAYSRLYIGYDMTIDNEIQAGNGMLDDFELHDGPAIDPAWFPPNLNFFKAKYLQ